MAVPVNNPKRAYPTDKAQLDSFIIGEPAMPFDYGDLDHELEQLTPATEGKYYQTAVK